MGRVVIKVVCFWILVVALIDLTTGSPTQTTIPSVSPLASVTELANPSYNVTCIVMPRDKELHATILGLKAENVKLIHYKFKIGDLNPLTHLATEGWARVSQPTRPDPPVYGVYPWGDVPHDSHSGTETHADRVRG